MSLQIALQNQTSSNQVYAYITGQAISNNNALFLLEADGKTAYYPASPSSTGQPLAQNCAIPLGGPGSTIYVTVPYLAGARLWFSVNDTLEFLLNPGPGLVEPSVANSSDPNINKTWDFCEFTFNSAQLYANISYVDFVCLPISLTLTTNGTTQHVSGMPANGLSTVISDLQAQSASDGQPWGSMVVNNGLRVLSPNTYIGGNSNAYNGYFEPYVSSCWNKYGGSQLSVDTQAQWGTVTGQTSGGNLSFGGGGSFSQPSSADIFSCSTGPFAGGSAEQLNIGARLAASLNRSTLLAYGSQPDGTNPSEYYKTSPTNHYGRILHQVNLDGTGYTFPYDDVSPAGGQNVSGYVNGPPTLWTVAVGGNNATADLKTCAARQTALMKAAPAHGTPVHEQDPSSTAPKQPAAGGNTKDSTSKSKLSLGGVMSSLKGAMGKAKGAVGNAMSKAKGMASKLNCFK